MNPVYPAADVNALLDQTTASIEQLMGAVQQRDEEISRLKSANAESVRLQKVASVQDATAPDDRLINKVVDQLVADSYIAIEDRAKIAFELNDPDNILKLTSRILEISSAIPTQGRGIPKSASEGSGRQLPEDWTADGRDLVSAV